MSASWAWGESMPGQRAETVNNNSNILIMKHTNAVRGLAVLAVCAFALTTVASLENPVQRPLKVVGSGTVIVDLSTGEYLGGGSVSEHGGRGTHLGLFTNEVSGNIYTGGGVSTTTVASGDELFWEDTGPNEIAFIGGTGRFEGCTGGFTLVYSNEVITFPDENTMIYSFTYVGTGTITY